MQYTLLVECIQRLFYMRRINQRAMLLKAISY